MLGAGIFDDRAGKIWEGPVQGIGSLKPLMLKLASHCNLQGNAPFQNYVYILIEIVKIATLLSYRYTYY